MPPPHVEHRCCCSCGSRNSNGCGRSSVSLSPLQQSQSDHLLQSIADRLLLLLPQQPQPPLDLFSSNLHRPHPSFLLPRRRPLRSQDSDISAVLRRLQVLEASLCNFHSSSSSVLRDAAARVIQLYFRAFLVRRSRTLRQLKRLAHIKSLLETLKSNFSDSCSSDLDYFSLTARRLLFQLDSVEGMDPIIVNGKKSIGLELIRFIEHLDALFVEKCKISTKPMNFVKESRVLADKIRGKKKNADTFSRFGNGNEDVGCIHSDKGYEFKPLSAIGNGKKNGYMGKTEKRMTTTDSVDFSIPLCPPIGGSFSSEEEEISGSIDRDHESKSYTNCIKSSKNNLRTGNSFIDNRFQNCDRDFIFSAPLPMKMESRAGSDDV